MGVFIYCKKIATFAPKKRRPYNKGMGIADIILLAVGLSMDAFAVAIGKGLSVSRVRAKHLLSAGVWFGGFQAVMPIVGYFLGVRFSQQVESFDHWVAFVLLALIGANMVRESRAKSNEECDCSEGRGGDFSARTMLLLAIATSIDALAVGVSFAFLSINIWSAATIIGCTTFAFSAIGIILGREVGCRYKSKAEVAGGVILLIIGTKILLEHTLFA